MESPSCWYGGAVLSRIYDGEVEVWSGNLFVSAQKTAVIVNTA